MISGNEFEHRELLALEKETLGTYLSSHPLAEVRDALRARVDCPIRDLERKNDNSWVKVGGLVTECKTIRTKSGNQMMFATLDDVEAQVEMLVFKADTADSAQVIKPDAVVIVRGRVDHKEAGETKLVVTEAEAFEPNAAEIARAGAAARAPQGPVRLTIDAADFAPTIVDDLKAVFEQHRGEAEVILVMRTRSGTRCLRFGPGYRVRDCSGLRAELDSLLGSGALAA